MVNKSPSRFPSLLLGLLFLTPFYGMAAERININTAQQMELEALPGIGPGKAKAILDYREKHGSFTRAQELDAVPGIGPKTLLQLRDHISFAPPPVKAEAAVKTPAPAPGAMIKSQGKTRFFDTHGRPIHLSKPTTH